MSRQLFCLIAISLGLTACSGGEAPSAAAEKDEAPAAAAQPAGPEAKVVVDEALLHHMHAHAEMLDEINYALADGDLEAAITPAYWLAKHHDFKGMPDEWKGYAEGMREAAAKVESAKDLESARAAADRIVEHCRDCHTAAGITADYN